jgi:hypothetical protein
VRVVQPVLGDCAANQLKARMPVEALPGNLSARARVTHLEAIGRTLCGIAPWLSVKGSQGSEEEASRSHLSGLARLALDNIVNPSAADYLNFASNAQNLVDAAFLALGLSRARTELWENLGRSTQQGLIAALKSTRRFKPYPNNWMLFSSMIEAFLAGIGEEWQTEPINAAFMAHEYWYKGDGAYGDGSDFHWDHYNSYVIHPLLMAVLDLMQPIDSQWDVLRASILTRAKRYAAVQERLIAPDGSFPAIGRSITYRCGAFHHLATMALRHDLPKLLTPSQVRVGLGAVIRRTLSAPDTFDKAGWLRIGLAGHQPSLAEGYISTGSLYLCTFAFLPLGLEPTDEFWTAPDADYTSRKLWSGADLQPDHAISEEPGLPGHRDTLRIRLKCKWRKIWQVGKRTF